RMRTADFIRDQEYTEKKLAFLSRWDFGTGVALGLEVQRIDGDSLLVSPGFAVDGCGRWLIVDEPAICRIRTLQGFDALHGEAAILWLAYHEELTDPMFVPGERDEVQEYAVAQERFSFRLTDMCTLPGAAGDQVLFSDVVLFEDADLRIRQVIPRILPARGLVQLKLVIESFCTERLEIGLHYFPELPGWNPANGGQPLYFDQTLQLEEGETSLILTGALDTTAQAILLSLPERGFMLEKRGVQLRAQDSFQEKFSVVTGDPLAALENSLLSHDPQELWASDWEEGVPIAGIRLLRYRDQVLLDGIFPLSKSRRAVLPCLKERLQYCSAFFPAFLETGAQERIAGDSPPTEALLKDHRQMATGVVTLNAGLHLREGNILRSDEIVHELGPGTVFIEFGIENVYPATGIDRNYTDLLLGDASLFSQASGTYDCGFDRGVRIHPEEGTFELAVRLKGELRQTSLRLRWFAWRAEEHTAHKLPVGTLLRLEPDIARVAPGAAVNFVPVFEHGTGSPCDFLIPDNQSGLITPNGIYTAPTKDGLYQVCAQIKDMPETRVSAYVIVRTWMEGAEHADGTL
ncbi:MAG: hypothetical protein K2N78_10895, partial [Oscillospiraceae bacterium]|nr:hypothetical protein [Oscillospiraceae bacterium]